VRVAVVGAGGRMGQEVCRAVAGDPDLGLVAVVDPRLEAGDLGSLPGSGAQSVATGTSVADLDAQAVDVVVDFTVAPVAAATMKWAAAHGVHAVVGTTGLSPTSVAELEELFRGSAANCILAANFAVGAVLMMRLAELAAGSMDGVEIVEMHHAGKLDAPSGTALRTAEVIDQARRSSGRGPWPADRTESMVVAGARGAQGPGGIRIHALRLPGVVSHQEVVFSTRGQSLTLRHDAFDRSAYMPGVLLAVKAVAGRPGLTVGLEPLLGF
jgi:4-hydroxy-tetrahydrodipicolinate reductase